MERWQRIKNETITIRMPRGMMNEVRKLAAQKDASIAHVFREAVQFYLPTAVLDCTGAPVISCDTTLTGVTSSFSDVVTDYGCNGTTYDGHEEVYELTTAVTQNIDITITHGGGERLDVFLLDQCDEFMGCIAWGDDTISQDLLPAGTYYIVVDGERNGDTGPFDIEVSCNPSSTLTCSSSCTSTIFSEDFASGLPGNWREDQRIFRCPRSSYIRY